ncbi:hypothetical protein DQ04_01171070 [Trypanosoma grayi]|uniref:hypothetical protein n=1 Tax=Trypanosoma grayi TaxID=71804 RepID=UPI0004F495B2|nr:hypothetical protein DQ04_01171070 [Trypanosoma grayi]KEG13174.1 hypothetical protein DQ04_01171070 [Trypanosoma grayi]
MSYTPTAREQAPVGDPFSRSTSDEPLDTVHVEALSLDSQAKPLSEPRRFASLTVGVFSCICCSIIFSFNLFSRDLQRKYNFSQNDVSSINTVGLVFCYVALPYGALYDWLGPRPVYFLAFTLLPVGALCFSLVFADVIPGNVVVLCVFNALMGAGAMMFDLGAAITVLSLFPSNRGAVVAVMKTFTGLGSAIIGSIQLGFFEGRPDRYFLFLMSLTLVVGVACFFVVKLPPYHLTGYEKSHLTEKEKKRRLNTRSLYLTQIPPRARFMFGIGLAIVLMLYLPMQSALVAYLALGRAYKAAFAALAIVLVMLYPLMIFPLRTKQRRLTESLDNLVEGSPTEIDDAMVTTEIPRKERPVTDRSGQAVRTDVDYIAPQYQTTFLQSLCTVRLWAIFWAIFTIFGSELVFISNSGFILGALSGEPVSPSLNTLLTVLNGVGSGVGRLLMSALEVWTQGKKPEDRIPITVSLFFPTTSIIVAVVLFLTLPAAALPLPYVIAAMGNGFGAAIIVLVSRTIFAKDSAKHYDFCYVAVMLSAIILNRFAYGEWYTREAEKQGSTLCYGKNCVMMPMLLFLGLNVTAFLSNIYVHLDYRRFCAKTLRERRRMQAEAQLELEEKSDRVREAIT